MNFSVGFGFSKCPAFAFSEVPGPGAGPGLKFNEISQRLLLMVTVLSTLSCNPQNKFLLALYLLCNTFLICYYDN